MYRQCFNLVDEEDKRRLTTVNAPITGFNQSIAYPLGQLTFPVELSDGLHSRTVDVDFLVMETPHPQYDIILGREAIGDFNATPSTTHGIVGVPTPTGIAMIHANRDCNMVDRKTPPQNTLKLGKTKEVEKWILNKKFPEQSITIGPTISEEAWAALKSLLVKNIDVFAWTPADMTGVSRSKAGHELNDNPTFIPVVQKRRKMGPEQAKACDEQVQQLIDAGIIREIQYQTWVANPVMAPKANGQWRMFQMLFRRVQRVSPDPHGAKRPRQNGVQNEQQNILLQNDAIRPQERRVYLPKADGQRIQTSDWKKFGSLHGRFGHQKQDGGAMLKDIEETFGTLRSISMKLNPGKCSFGMEEGKFLGVIVTNGGFKANPEKLEAVHKMLSPKSVKQVQTLNGRLVALNRFLSSHAEISFPFVSTLRNYLKKSQFRWTEEAETAFQEIKSCIEELPTLQPLKLGNR
ncbi:uncharacterized protein LOC143571036 [Bidens hawaiensis]|uniref:uncharacterized protein LOC143571036 n=1 Tax=Bidens hawaiensis TaxID=980011 RepID=UPI00404B3A08